MNNQKINIDKLKEQRLKLTTNALLNFSEMKHGDLQTGKVFLRKTSPLVDEEECTVDE